jgi:nitrogen fixation-related uncharacterized protein
VIGFSIVLGLQALATFRWSVLASFWGF